MDHALDNCQGEAAAGVTDGTGESDDDDEGDDEESRELEAALAETQLSTGTTINAALNGPMVVGQQEQDSSEIAPLSAAPLVRGDTDGAVTGNHETAFQYNLDEDDTGMSQSSQPVVKTPHHEVSAFDFSKHDATAQTGTATIDTRIDPAPASPGEIRHIDASLAQQEGHHAPQEQPPILMASQLMVSHLEADDEAFNYGAAQAPPEQPTVAAKETTMLPDKLSFSSSLNPSSCAWTPSNAIISSESSPGAGAAANAAVVEGAGCSVTNDRFRSDGYADDTELIHNSVAEDSDATVIHSQHELPPRPSINTSPLEPQPTAGGTIEEKCGDGEGLPRFDAAAAAPSPRKMDAISNITGEITVSPGKGSAGTDFAAAARVPVATGKLPHAPNGIHSVGGRQHRQQTQYERGGRDLGLIGGGGGVAMGELGGGLCVGPFGHQVDHQQLEQQLLQQHQQQHEYHSPLFLHSSTVPDHGSTHTHFRRFQSAGYHSPPGAHVSPEALFNPGGAIVNTSNTASGRDHNHQPRGVVMQQSPYSGYSRVPGPGQAPMRSLAPGYYRGRSGMFEHARPAQHHQRPGFVGGRGGAHGCCGGDGGGGGGGALFPVVVDIDSVAPVDFRGRPAGDAASGYSQRAINTPSSVRRSSSVPLVKNSAIVVGGDSLKLTPTRAKSNGDVAADADAVSAASADGVAGDVSLGEGVASGAGGGDSSQHNTAYNDIGLVVTKTKELEKLLKDLFGATGNGLNEQLSSLSVGSRIDRRTQSRIRSIASMRNKLVHSVDANNLTISNTFGHAARRAFKIMVDDLEVTLRESAARKPDDAAFEQASRPADAYTLGNHPAFRGLGGGVMHTGVGVGGQGDEGAVAEAAAAASAAAARRETEAVVIKDNARFPHNLITTKKVPRRNPSSTRAAPDVFDESAFPDIGFAASAGVKQAKKKRGGVAGGTEASSAAGTGDGSKGRGGSKGDWHGVTGGGMDDDVDSGGWDGQGRIEEAQVISGRGVCRTLGQGEVGYVATTHTMSGVYRKWDHPGYRKPQQFGDWTNDSQGMRAGRRVVPGAPAAKGQVAFEGRGLDIRKPVARGHHKQGRSGSSDNSNSNSSNNALHHDMARYHARDRDSERQDEQEELKWEAAGRRKRGVKEDRGPRSYVVRKTPAVPFWLLPGVQFGRSNCRGWFPTRQDWCARGIPECVYVPLEPSTEDRVAAMRDGHEPLIGLTLEEDEERLMRIAIRESAAESKRAYEKKYGSEAEREARREVQALARVKAMAERESLERDEQQQLTEVIKASLREAPGPGEKDDRAVMAAIEVSKREHQAGRVGSQHRSVGEDDEDPDVLLAIAESRRQHEARQAMLLRQLGVSPPPSARSSQGIVPTASSLISSDPQREQDQRDADLSSGTYPGAQTTPLQHTTVSAMPQRQQPLLPPSSVPQPAIIPPHSGSIPLDSSVPGQSLPGPIDWVAGAGSMAATGWSHAAPAEIAIPPVYNNGSFASELSAAGPEGGVRYEYIPVATTVHRAALPYGTNISGDAPGQHPAPQAPGLAEGRTNASIGGMNDGSSSVREGDVPGVGIMPVAVPPGESCGGEVNARVIPAMGLISGLSQQRAPAPPPPPISAQQRHGDVVVDVARRTQGSGRFTGVPISQPLPTVFSGYTGGVMPQQQQSGVQQQQPGVQHQQSEIQQQQPRVQHQQPGIQHQQPGLRQQQPGVRQQQPGILQQQPGIQHEQPGIQHQQPGLRQQQPGVQHEQPGIQHQQPGLRQQQPGVQQLQPGVQQQQPGVQQQQPGVQQQQPGVQQQHQLPPRPPQDRQGLGSPGPQLAGWALQPTQGSGDGPFASTSTSRSGTVVRNTVPQNVPQNGPDPSGATSGAQLASCAVRLEDSEGTIGEADLAQGRPSSGQDWDSSTRPLGGERVDLVGDAAPVTYAWGMEPSVEEKQMMQAIDASKKEALARQVSSREEFEEEREMRQAIEVSRLADLARQQEEQDAKEAMEMALQMSVMDIGGRTTHAEEPGVYDPPQPSLASTTLVHSPPLRMPEATASLSATFSTATNTRSPAGVNVPGVTTAETESRSGWTTGGVGRQGDTIHAQESPEDNASFSSMTGTMRVENNDDVASAREADAVGEGVAFDGRLREATSTVGAVAESDLAGNPEAGHAGTVGVSSVPGAQDSREYGVRSATTTSASGLGLGITSPAVEVEAVPAATASRVERTDGEIMEDEAERELRDARAEEKRYYESCPAAAAAVAAVGETSNAVPVLEGAGGVVDGNGAGKNDPAYPQQSTNNPDVYPQHREHDYKRDGGSGYQGEQGSGAVDGGDAERNALYGATPKQSTKYADFYLQNHDNAHNRDGGSGYQGEQCTGAVDGGGASSDAADYPVTPQQLTNNHDFPPRNHYHNHTLNDESGYPGEQTSGVGDPSAGNAPDYAATRQPSTNNTDFAPPSTDRNHNRIGVLGYPGGQSSDARSAFAVGGEAGAEDSTEVDGQGQGVDDDLARVLEQSRLEAEHQAAAAAAAREVGIGGREGEEEELMARVIAESIREQERRDTEQREYQRAMEASLMSGSFST